MDLHHTYHQFLLRRAILSLIAPSLLPFFCPCPAIPVPYAPEPAPEPAPAPAFLLYALALINALTNPDLILFYLILFYFILFLLFIVICFTFTPIPLFLLSHYLYLVGV